MAQLVEHIHDNIIDTSNTSFKNDLARKNNVDTMVVRVKEVIDEATLYKVKRIMNDTFSVNLPLTENELKDRLMEEISAFVDESTEAEILDEQREIR